MNSLDRSLVLFSVAFAVAIGLLLVVPIVRRKHDLFTSWNVFLVGAFVFNGLSGLNAVDQQYLPSLSRSTYALYYVGVVVFYGSAIATYFYAKTPRRLAGRTMLRWPPVSSATAPLIAGSLLMLVVLAFSPVSIPFVSQILLQFAFAAPVLALSVATIAWMRDRTNVLLAGVMVAVFCVAGVMSVSSGGTRRLLIAVLAAVPVCAYWEWLRYKSSQTIVVVLAAAIGLAVPVLMGFSAIRHADGELKTNVTERARVVLTSLPKAIKSGGSSEGFTGQDSVECALSAIELLHNGSRVLTVHPLASLWLMLTNPIPREVWPGKPDSLGLTLAESFGFGSAKVNLGLNVVGQCYYDGGLAVHLLYGVLIGLSLRYFDELLVRQPGNPLLVGTLAMTSGQILGWPRGCIGLISLQWVSFFVLLLLTQWVGRLILGTGTVYPRTDHVLDYPVLRSHTDVQKAFGSRVMATAPVRHALAAE